jgi:hypothetical protein
MKAQSQDPIATSLLEWRRSSRCGSDACVEVAIFNRKVFVRNSKNASDKYLIFDAEEWKSFIAGAQNNEFDIE